jgi:hypothetical protein
MAMEHRWIDTDRGKPKYLEENLSQCHFVHRTYHNDLMTGLEYNSGVYGDKPAIKGVRHGKTTSNFFFSNATTCPLRTSWSPLPVVAEV